MSATWEQYRSTLSCDNGEPWPHEDDLTPTGFKIDEALRAAFEAGQASAASLIRAQADALLAAQAALAAYEVAHDQDQGAWSLAGLHDAEALSVNAQAKIDALKAAP